MTVCYWCGAKDTLADVGKELDNGKYKMVQCLKCKNAYYVVNKEKMNKQKPQTNEEWLNGLSTTEKSEFMVKMVTDAIKEHGEHGVTRCESVIWWDEWLKQPHQLTTK